MVGGVSLGVEGVLLGRVLRLVGDALRACEAELDRELADPQAWVLQPDGSYSRGGPDGP